MDVDMVLVPIDGSERAMEAVEYAAAIADRYDAALHVLYMLGAEAAAALDSGTIEATAVAERGEQVMAAVRALVGDTPLDHSSACGFSVSRLSQHPGSVILDVAESLDADFVVIPRQPAAGAPDAVIEKAAEYVLAYASQPVLSV